MSDPKLSDDELKRRQGLAHAMGRKVVAEAKTEVWDYAVRVAPELLTDDNDDWRVSIEGTTATGRHRSESFDVSTARAYHKLLGAVLAKYDEGKIRNPWEKPDGE